MWCGGEAEPCLSEMRCARNYFLILSRWSSNSKSCWRSISSSCKFEGKEKFVRTRKQIKDVVTLPVPLVSVNEAEPSSCPFLHEEAILERRSIQSGHRNALSDVPPRVLIGTQGNAGAVGMRHAFVHTPQLLQILALT